jgi:ribose/xylose/arabinose/galactoside ABC-type transport system permease subunit
MNSRNLNVNERTLRLLKVHPRDLIVIVMITLLLLIFVTKALQFGLIGNLQILAITMATVGIVSIGQTLVVLTGGVDLSVGSIIALTGVIIAYLTTTSVGVNSWIAAGIGLLIATMVGWLHGIFITRFKLAPFIVTFGSLSLLRGLAQVISNGSAINLRTNAFDWLWNNAFGIIPIPALVMALLFIISAFMLRNTRQGRYVYAIGNNETVTRLSGVNVERTQQIIYAISGFFAGLAGLFLLARIAGGSFHSGENYELLSIAAVIIGGTSLKGGTGGVWGTLAGVLLISLVSNGLVLISVPPLWKEAITGALIITAALIDVQRRRLQESTPILTRRLSPPIIKPSMPLDESLKQLARTIQRHFGYDEIRVYLHDRESGSLVEPSSRASPGGTLTLKSYSTAKPLFLNDLKREQEIQIIPWQSANRAAAAVPIQYSKRVIGTLEVQSSIINVFSPQALETVALLATQMAPNIEDRWLLESGWLTQQVRECLRNLEDDVYLNHCALADWLQINALTRRSEFLRQILYDAMESIGPQSTTSNSRATRRYQLLKQTFVDQLAAEMICQNLGLSRRQYFYDLKQAVDEVVDFLYMQRPQISLRYDAPPITHQLPTRS